MGWDVSLQEATAANAIHSLQQMVHMAIDLLNEDCIWQIE